MQVDGLICLDDWNDVYGQVRAAYYYWRYALNSEWELLLTGFNKAFLCHQSKFDVWSKFLIATVGDDILVDDQAWLVQLSRTDYNPHARNFNLRNRKLSDPFFYGQNT